MLRIRELLDLVACRQIQRLPPTRVVGGGSDRGFVHEEPGFLHPHRHHADCWRLRAKRSGGLGHRIENLAPSYRRGLTFGIAVNEQQFRRLVEFENLRNPLRKQTRRVLQSTQVRPLGMNRANPVFP
jgi:hypothetical protein